MLSPEIVPYSLEHWQSLQSIHDAARKQELSLAGLEEAFLPLCIAAEREDLFSYQVYLALEEGEAVGFVAFTEEELAWLYVSPQYHRQGIGKALARFALLHMAPGEKTVEVLAGNEPARSLYRGLGFSEEELLHGVMPGNEEYSVSVWRMRCP